MSRPREIGLTVIVVVGILWVLSLAVRPDQDVRNFEFLPDMVTSVAKETFAASDLLPGGSVQQPLVAGVVPTDAEPFPFGPGPEEATRAGEAVTGPALDPDDLDRGRRLYSIYCAVCHDEAGGGDSPVVTRGAPRPPSLLADRARLLPDGALYHILTRGQGNMASYEAQLRPLDRWRVIGWVRELQGR